MRNDTMLSVAKIGHGCYLVENDYIVQRTPDGWRWFDKHNLGTGGEWRATMRDALLDVEAFLSEVARG